MLFERGLRKCQQCCRSPRSPPDPRTGLSVYALRAPALEGWGSGAYHRLQFSSASRFIAGAAGFVLLIQSSDRPER